tara:strand:- start:403 stop:1299 length:897 start_codon:yes stop_codon:yes gene_type:complete
MKYKGHKKTLGRYYNTFRSHKKPLIQRLLRELILDFRVIKLFSNWHVYFLNKFHFLKKKHIICKLRKGIKYKLRTDKGDFHIINYILNIGVYNQLMNYIKDNSVVIDVGAHIGIFSILAAKIASNVRVYSYEPDKDNYNLLKENIRINNLESNIIPVQEGVCEKKGRRTLIISKESFAWHSMFSLVSKVSHSSFKKSDKETKKINMKCVTLKNIFDNFKISKCHFLKMNCEGAEYEILFNTPPRYLKKIESMTIEYHANKDIKELIKFLENNGFVSVIEAPKFGNFSLLYVRNLRGGK